jgi:hypothetical protein
MNVVDTVANYRFRAAWFRVLAADATLPSPRDRYVRLAEEFEALAAKLEAAENAAPSPPMDASSP